MAFKQDEDFLRYLTMGAAGTRHAAEHLESLGHRVAELERYSTANKLWATKIKRLRLPDLLCLLCGLRVEAKAKSSLEIKLSHSSVTGREWDAGLRDEDLVAFVPCVMAGPELVSVGSPEYYEVDALRRTVDLAQLGPPKAASQGAERDLKWPAIVPTRSGTVLSIDPARVTVELAGGRRQSYANRWPAWTVSVPVGGTFAGGQRFLAGPVERPSSLECRGATWDPARALDAPDAMDRYAAVKACGLLGRRDVLARIVDVANSGSEDERVRLEAMGALARLEEPGWADRLEEAARDDRLDAGLALEAVFILSEIATVATTDALIVLARDASLGPDTRSAAVWGLGVTGARRPESLIDFIGDDDDLVALHAIAAMPADVSDSCLERLAGGLGGDERTGAAASEVLLRQGDRGVSYLLEVAIAGGSALPRAIVALGRAPRATVLRIGGDRIAPELRQLLEPLWADGETNWIRAGTTPYELALLERQTLSGRT